MVLCNSTDSFFMFIFLNFNIFLACGQNMSIPVPLPLFGLCNNLRRFFFGLSNITVVLFIV